ncbi:hypothetical protein AMJ86_09050, partial [bacterium SM23_57]
HVGITMSPLVEAIWTDIPDILNATRVRVIDIKSLFQNGDRSFYQAGVAFVDSTIFDVLTLPLMEGDTNTALTRPNTIVLGEEMSQKLFGDESPLGKIVTWADRLLEVTAVMYDVPENSHLQLKGLISYDVAKEIYPWMSNWPTSCLATFIRLSEDASPKSIESKIHTIFEQHTSTEEAQNHHFYLQPLKDIHLGSSHILYQYNYKPGNRVIIYALILIALFILLLACINYINLTTARAVKRSQEIGIRKVTGAKRKDLIIQFLTESMSITLISLVLALVVVELLLPIFRTITNRDLSWQFPINPFTWIAIIGGVILVGLISGSYPALYLSNFQPVQAIRTLRWSSIHGSKLRRALVVLQFTISIALITSTLIIANQLYYLQHKNLGFNRDKVIVVPMSGTTLRSQREILKEKILEHPSVRYVSAISNTPGEDFPQLGASFEGMSEDNEWAIAALSVDDDYLETLGAELIQGRNFSPDITTDKESAIIINQTAAAQLQWEDPIGKELHLSWLERKGPIIGIVRDFHYRTLHHTIEPLAIVMEPFLYSKLLIRTDGTGDAGVIAAIRNTWQELAPAYPFEYSFLDADLIHLYDSEKNTATLIMIFAVLAIMIACLGLFGLSSFIAEQRTKEIGIRKALGATVTSIVSLISREFILLVFISNIIAWPIAYYGMSNWLQGFAYRIDITWLTFLMGTALAVLIAAITVTMQALKAALANPIDSLKYE